MRCRYLLLVRIRLSLSNIQNVCVVEDLCDPLLLARQAAVVLVNGVFRRIDTLHHLGATLILRTIFRRKLVLLLLQDAIGGGLMIIDCQVCLRPRPATAVPCSASSNALVE